MSPFGICLQNPDIREKPGYPVQPFEFGVCMSSPEEGLAQGDRVLMEPERFILGLGVKLARGLPDVVGCSKIASFSRAVCGKTSGHTK